MYQGLAILPCKESVMGSIPIVSTIRSIGVVANIHPCHGCAASSILA